MRREFIGHHPPTSDEIDNLWENAIVILDTNVLLNLYRLSPGARDKLIEILRISSDRLWIPHQVGYEFHENRVDVIREQRGIGRKIESVLESFKKGLSSVLQEYSQNAFFEPSTLQTSWDSVVDAFKNKVREMHSSQMGSYAITPQNDPVLGLIAAMYDGKVGPKPSTQDLETLHATAKDRFENSIPPGYRDAKNKPEPRRYGDYVIWWQIIEHARDKGSDVLFVTDDSKSDWWWESGGEVLGPEPRLRKEFNDETGRLFYSYRSNQFVRIFDERRSIPVDEAVVEEIRAVGENTNLGSQRKPRDTSELIALLKEQTGMTDRDIADLIIGGRHRPRNENHAISLTEIESRIVHAQNRRRKVADRSITLRARIHEKALNLKRAENDGDSERVSQIEKEIQRLEDRLAEAEFDLQRAEAELNYATTQALNIRELLDSGIQGDTP